MRDGALMVTDLAPGGSAKESGLISVGDVIMQVEGKAVKFADEATALMSGRDKSLASVLVQVLFAFFAFFASLPSYLMSHRT